MIKLFFLLLGLLPGSLLAQGLTVRGQVVSAATGAPVPNASISVPPGGGVVADAQGYFALTVPPVADHLLVSSVGFAPQKVQLANGQLPDGARVALRPQPQALGTVAVQHGKLRAATIGRRARHDAIIGRDDVALMGHYPTGTNQGWEGGNLYHFGRASYLESFHVYVTVNPCKAIRFRLNFYAVVKGRPTRLLFQDDIQFEVASRQPGWTTVDLRPYNLHVEPGQDVAVTMQWLDDQACPAQGRPFVVPSAYPSWQRSIIRSPRDTTWRVNRALASMYLSVLTE